MALVKRSVTITEERRTYILGEFTGKFYGVPDTIKGNGQTERYFDLKVYEAAIVVNSKDHIHPAPKGPFEGFTKDDTFPGKLPDPLPCDVQLAPFTDSYKLQLHDPMFKEGSIIIVDHQDEGDEVFGTLKATISGYIKDTVTHEEEQSFIEEEPEPQGVTNPDSGSDTQTKPVNGTSTGNGTGKHYGVNPKGSYKKRYYQAEPYEYGWKDVFLAILIILLLILFIAYGGLEVVLVILFYVFLIAFAVAGTRVFTWLLNTIGVLYIAFVVFAIVSGIRSNWNSSGRSGSVPTVNKKDNQNTVVRDGRNVPRRAEPIPGPVIDETYSYDTSSTVPYPIDNTQTIPDTLISHYRVWQSYDGATYEGNLQIRLSDYKQSAGNRMMYGSRADLLVNKYDALLYNLYTNDKPALNQVYLMFDSIKAANNLDAKAFAEMIVTCIQDIPYTLLLNDDCNPYLYNDRFIRSYLSSGKSCSGNVKFGIFAPAEFIGSLKGDCDTRTLLLLTILSHYNYEVALLSSEYYKHSLLAINLPYDGSYKSINGKRFYAWETTYPDFKPGALPSEISNMDFWRVSLLNQRQNP